MKTFHCDNCNRQVFFENTSCENCGWLLGYQPEHQIISSFIPAESAPAAIQEGQPDNPMTPHWSSINPVNQGRLFRQCRNYAEEGLCNWMIDANDGNPLCASCRLTTVIPSLANQQNRVFWQRLEVAKRRLLHTLWTLHLQPRPKQGNADVGLAFEFLENIDHGEHILTGHANGTITINIAEADPAYREKMREQMAEPYRTLLGHFRHESGHYYFDRLVAGTPRLDMFRQLFGDEGANYADSLQRHYEQGPPADWNQRFVSIYASSHPWEDWAETWAHYLHLFDTLETAHACGVQLQPRHQHEQALRIDAAPLDTGAFDELITAWFALTYVLNSLNRSIGMPDSYPFVLPTPVLAKLRFVHEIVQECAHGDTAAAGQAIGAAGESSN